MTPFGDGRLAPLPRVLLERVVLERVLLERGLRTGPSPARRSATS